MNCNTALERPIWSLLDECWTPDPVGRPGMRRIEGRIQKLRLLEVVITDSQSGHTSHPPVSLEGNKNEKEEKKGADQEAVLPRDAVDEIAEEKPSPVVPPSPKPPPLSVPKTLTQRARRRLFNLMRLGRRSTDLSSQP